jgi:hypothetical protein
VKQKPSFMRNNKGAPKINQIAKPEEYGKISKSVVDKETQLKNQAQMNLFQQQKESNLSQI